MRGKPRSCGGSIGIPASSSGSNATWQSPSRQWRYSCAFWLAVTPPLPESAQAAAKAKGAERYRDFVETLGRRLQRGNSLVREISLEIWPEQRGNGAGSAIPRDPDVEVGDIADAR